MLPPPSCPGPPVGGGLRPAPLGKGSVSHRFPLLRNAPSPRRGGPMCPPGHASSRDPFTGRHTGRPLRSRSKYPSTPEERAGTEPRPYRSIVGVLQRPDVGIGPYERRGSPIDRPGQWRRAERLRQRSSQGVGLGRGRDHPQISSNLGQSLSRGLWPRQLPLHKGALPCGGRGSGRTHGSAPTWSSE